MPHPNSHREAIAARPNEPQTVRIAPAGLIGALRIPPEPAGLVMFSHGKGSSHISPRNTFIAQALDEIGIATLLLDLRGDQEPAGNVAVDVELRAERLCQAVAWLDRQTELAGLPLGLCGNCSGGAAAVVAATRLGHRISALVLRGGRLDLVQDSLPELRAPSLFVVGGNDDAIIEAHERLKKQLTARATIRIVPGAGRHFSEPGALAAVAVHACDWFSDCFSGDFDAVGARRQA